MIYKIYQEQNTKFYIYILFVVSLFISSIFGENSSGGAYLDFISTKEFIDAFESGYLNGFKWFLSFGQIHLPFFYLLKSILRDFFSHLEMHVLYIFISSMVPLVFYKVLKKKYINSDKYYAKDNDRNSSPKRDVFLSPYFVHNDQIPKILNQKEI